MTDTELLEAFRRVRSWVSADQRAPHKAIVLLLALAQVQRKGARLLSFVDVEPQIRELLIDYGPHRQSVHPEYPFWRLRNDDGLWAIPEGDGLEVIENASGDVPISALRDLHARGGFDPTVYEKLLASSDLVNAVVADLLERTFPASLHDALLDASGFPWVVQGRPSRDPKSREEILSIYERRCAICSYDGRLGGTELGLEAAHVKWHAAGGPDTPQNGFALCSFHHVAFDRGAIGVSESLRVLVSQDVSGQSNVSDLLVRFSGAELRRPQPGTPSPAPSFLAWHRREVFWDPPRQ